MDLKGYQNKRHAYTIENLLVILFGFWAVFQNIWLNLRISQYLGSVAFSVIILWIIAIFTLIMHLRLKAKSLYIWLVFFLCIGLQVVSGKAIWTSTLADLSVYFCTFIICSCVDPNMRNKDLLMKTLIISGLFIAFTVLIDQVTHLFRSALIGIYSNAAASYKLHFSGTGGILPNTAAAGGFIVSGLACYITRLRIQKKRPSIKNWIIILIYSVSFVVIRKRGFALDIIAALFILYVAGFIWKPNKSSIDIKRFIRRLVLLFGIVAAGLVLYNYVPFIRDAADTYIKKFLREDTTLSGRTFLFALAIQLFKTSPIFGIGWARYRTYTRGVLSSNLNNTYDAHNVYLQVLSETGIVGLVFYVIALIAAMIPGARKLKESIRNNDEGRRPVLELGMFLQLFYLFYSLSGNPLYDYTFFVVYFIGILMTFE